MPVSILSTDKAQEKFLKSFARYGNVSKAARAAGIDRSLPYKWKEADEAFAQAWKSAKEEAGDVLEGEAFRRAVTGVSRDVLYQGIKVSTEKHYGDALLTLLLKANRPEKFKERVSNEHTGPSGGPVEVTITRTVVRRET